MTPASPLWPARLHHLHLTTEQPAGLLDFYRAVLGNETRELSDGTWLVAGAERRLLVGPGPANRLGYAGFALDEAARLEALRDYLSAKGLDLRPSPSPLFSDGAFALSDPDGNTLAFGTPAEAASGGDEPPGRLQHVVVASDNVEAVSDFYQKVLGFVLSDTVLDDEGVTASFLRSDEEHHSFAVFRAPGKRLDHFAFETTCWNDIHDWADRLGSMRIALGWGPGRHGPGNNLFFMINDPDGNALEFSAEIEHMPRQRPAREWPHEAHTLNLWGEAWMRS